MTTVKSIVLVFTAVESYNKCSNAYFVLNQEAHI